MDEKFWEKINTYGENGEFDKVVREIKKLPEDKLDIELINVLGRSYMNLGDYENALDTYLKKMLKMLIYGFTLSVVGYVMKLEIMNKDLNTY